MRPEPVFVDSNIPMYLIGAPHPHKTLAREMLGHLVARGTPLVTDAEVFQEILHRYKAIRRPDAITAAFRLLEGIVDRVFAVGLADVQEARRTLLQHPDLSARDAVHAAVMKQHGLRRVFTFDTALGRIPGLERIAD